MMSVEVFKVALLLLPGFISHEMVYFAVALRPKAAPERFIDASVRTFIISAVYSVIVAVFSWMPFLPALPDISEVLSASKSSLEFPQGVITRRFIVAIVGVTLASGTAEIYARRFALLPRVLRWMRASSRTGGIDVWQEVMLDPRVNWVRVTLSDGRIAQGYIRYHSDFGEVSELFLGSVRVYNPSDGSVEEMDGLYISPHEKVRLIEVMDYPELRWK